MSRKNLTTSKKTDKVGTNYGGIDYSNYLELKNNTRNNSKTHLISRASSKKFDTKMNSRQVSISNIRRSPDSVLSIKKHDSRNSSLNEVKNPRASTGQSSAKMRFNMNFDNKKPTVSDIDKLKQQPVDNSSSAQKKIRAARSQSLEKFFDSMGNLHYEGQTTSGLANGLGKLYFSSGLLEYNGEFKNNLLDGYGKLFNENGLLVYSGEFAEGKKFGYGIEWYANKSKLYEGKWIDDKWHGYGVWYSAEGGVISEGVFQYGKPTMYIGTNFALPNVAGKDD